MNKLDREIDRLCLDVVLLDGEQDAAPDLSDMARRAKAILDARKPKPHPRRSLSLGRMKPSRAQKKAARASTRPLVAARENGRCAVSALGGCRGNLHWDHFFGRGKVPPSVELEWMLCEAHDHQKTEGMEDGNRLKWLRLFLMHAEFYGYKDAIERCHRAIAQEEGQHPEHERTGTR